MKTVKIQKYSETLPEQADWYQLSCQQFKNGIFYQHQSKYVRCKKSNHSKAKIEQYKNQKTHGTA